MITRGNRVYENAISRIPLPLFLLDNNTSFFVCNSIFILVKLTSRFRKKGDVMKAAIGHLVKKVTLELIYDVVDERTKELKDDIKSVNGRIDAFREETKDEIKSINVRLDQMRQEHKEDMRAVYDRFKTVDDNFNSVNARIDSVGTRIDSVSTRIDDNFKSVNARIDDNFKSVNARIDQIHTRLDQIMHMLADLRK
jgi:hypothetical protein